MANNRLYILDPATGEKCIIARSMGGEWTSVNRVEEILDVFFEQVGYEKGCNCGETETELKLITEYTKIEG